jgi:hypothetical protein
MDDRQGHIFISTDTDKAFEQNSSPFHDEKLNKVGLKGKFLNALKALVKNP